MSDLPVATVTQISPSEARRLNLPIARAESVENPERVENPESAENPETPTGTN